MQDGRASLLGSVAGTLWRHRRLAWEFARREFHDRYAGQVLGRIWALGHPLVLMSIYVFLFAFVLKLKVGGTEELPLDYPTYLLSGLIPWLACQDAMSKSTIAISGNEALVKQVVFPIEVLPVKGILASMVNQVIASLLLVGYVVVTHGTLPWTYALLPGLWLLEIVGLAGVSLLLSAASVYLRDLKEVVQVFSTINLYIMPVFFLPDWVPDLLRPILYLNPFSYLIWCAQDLCYFGRFQHAWAWGGAIGLAVLSFYVGARFFVRLKPGFANVL
jgi:lipopolysaccharide transport system permease protein